MGKLHKQLPSWMATVMGLVLVLFLTGCSSTAANAGVTATAPTPAADPAFVPGDVARGQVVFMGTCANCHGQNGRGDGWAADLVNQDDWLKKQTNETLYKFVSNGHNPPVANLAGMDDQKLKDAAAYVLTLGQK